MKIPQVTNFFIRSFLMLPQTLTDYNENGVPRIVANVEEYKEEDEEEKDDKEEEEDEENEEEYEEEGEYNPTRLQWALHMCGVHLTEREEEMCEDVHGAFSGSEN